MTARFLTVQLAALAICAGALAEVSKPLNVSIRVGTFSPATSTARDAGKSWFAFGAETRFKNLGVSASNPSLSSYLTVSVDTYGKGDFHATPVLVNYVMRNNELYFTGGAGISFIDEPGDTSNTRAAFQLGVGWDFQKGSTPLFVEAKWFAHSSNDHLNGLGLFVGVRL